jgi:PAS domain S-box-containing protein
LTLWRAMTDLTPEIRVCSLTQDVCHCGAAAAPTSAAALPAPTMASVIHELRVHQIELEQQNEELYRTSAALDSSRARYFDLFDLAPIGFCTVSEKGLIVEANLSAAKLLGLPRSGMIQQPLSRFVQTADQPHYYQWRRQVLQGTQAQVCELKMKNHAGGAFWAQLHATASGLASSDLNMRLVLSDITERKTTEAALHEAQLRLRNFTQRQQEEFDALRMELAHDVHDQLGQTLAALKLEIDGVRSLAPASATRMQALIMQGVSTIRDISRALRPIALELGLLPALGSMAAEMSGRSGIKITTRLPPGLPALPGQVERGLYHIAQEALTNSLLHASATEVGISLQVQRTQIELEVNDNGQGFAPGASAVNRGLGLLGMTERARQLGAELSLQSAPHQGTRITLKLRINPPDKFRLADPVEKPFR